MHSNIMRLALLLLALLAASTPATSNDNNMDNKQITIRTPHGSLTATLADNAATAELLRLLAAAPITIRMSDYGGFEKVGALPQALPTSNRNITTSAGDIMLYNGNQIVVFYGSNTWSYTPLGKIDGASRQTIVDTFGQGTTDMTLSRPAAAGISPTSADKDEDSMYTLQGMALGDNGQNPAPGIYIKGGKKVIVR